MLSKDHADSQQESYELLYAGGNTTYAFLKNLFIYLAAVFVEATFQK